MLNDSIDTLIFDLGNTLIDRNAALRLGLHGLFKGDPELQTVLEDIMQHDNWGYTGREEFCSWFLQTYGREIFRNFTTARLLKVFHLMILQNIEPVPAVQNALQSLATQFQFVLATNGSGITQRQKLWLAELHSFFKPETIFVSAETGYEKPDPQFFKKIINDLQLNPERTMAIGDNLSHDIHAASACGLYTCWVSHGREGETGIQPDKIISNITEISTWSKQLT